MIIEALEGEIAVKMCCSILEFCEIFLLIIY